MSFGPNTVSSKNCCLLSCLPHIGVFHCFKDHSGQGNLAMLLKSVDKSGCISGTYASSFLGIRICAVFKSCI